MKVIAVNNRKFDEDLLKDTITASMAAKHVELLLENANYYTTAKLDYGGGSRSPHLERSGKTADILQKIIAPRVN